MDILKLARSHDHYYRLKLIHEKVSSLISEFQPNHFAIEAPFYGKNVQSMLKLGRAQGVAIAAAIQSGLTVTEYSPRKVKQSITGNGNAAKEQVSRMLYQLLKLESAPASLDATDALAVAVCHHFQSNSLISGTNRKFNGWKEFLQQNPDKISAKMR